jgi:phosphinothricin acetyltransferase
VRAAVSPLETLVRDCEAHDVQAITAIYAGAVRHGCGSFEIEPPDAAEMMARRGRLVAGGFPYLVAERDGVLVGYAYAGPYRPRPAYGATVENSVYVHPDAQAKGVGSILMQHLIVAAEAGGFRQMVAVIGDSDNRASIALHERLGFRHVGTLAAVGWKHGRWLDSVLMQRPLGACDRTPRRDT